eukprot:7627588-Lingulodinium_polyedra.AAC.1
MGRPPSLLAFRKTGRGGGACAPGAGRSPMRTRNPSEMRKNSCHLAPQRMHPESCPNSRRAD